MINYFDGMSSHNFCHTRVQLWTCCFSFDWNDWERVDTNGQNRKKIKFKVLWKSHIYNSQPWLNHNIVSTSAAICLLSNSTCKTNSTSVGLSRSWLCFPTGRKEGRRRRRKNPHLTSSRRNDPTYLNFGWLYCGLLAGVLKLSGGCLKGVWEGTNVMS